MTMNLPTFAYHESGGDYISDDELTPGKWYALGFAGEDGTIDWAAAPLLKYEGDGKWSDEAGEEVEAILDPYLQLDVAPGSADQFVAQS